MMILWDSFDTEDPTREDKETLYQIVNGDYDLETRKRALQKLYNLPEIDAKMMLGKAASIPVSNDDDAEIQQEALEMLEMKC